MRRDTKAKRLSMSLDDHRSTPALDKARPEDRARLQAMIEVDRRLREEVEDARVTPPAGLRHQVRISIEHPSTPDGSLGLPPAPFRFTARLGLATGAVAAALVIITAIAVLRPGAGSAGPDDTPQVAARAEFDVFSTDRWTRLMSSSSNELDQTVNAQWGREFQNLANDGVKLANTLIEPLPVRFARLKPGEEG